MNIFRRILNTFTGQDDAEPEPKQYIEQLPDMTPNEYIARAQALLAQLDTLTRETQAERNAKLSALSGALLKDWRERLEAAYAMPANMREKSNAIRQEFADIKMRLWSEEDTRLSRWQKSVIDAWWSNLSRHDREICEAQQQRQYNERYLRYKQRCDNLAKATAKLANDPEAKRQAIAKRRETRQKSLQAEAAAETAKQARWAAWQTSHEQMLAQKEFNAAQRIKRAWAKKHAPDGKWREGLKETTTWLESHECIAVEKCFTSARRIREAWFEKYDALVAGAK